MSKKAKSTEVVTAANKPIVVPDGPIAELLFDGQTLKVVAKEGREDEWGEIVARRRGDIRQAAGDFIVSTLDASEPVTSSDVAGIPKRIVATASRLEGGSAAFRMSIATNICNLPDADQAASVVHDLQPRDAVETLLATQMAAVHSAMLNLAIKLGNTEYHDYEKFYEAAINRLARTYTTQVEALRKHRTGGTQTVRHVHVNEGGQAIVADTVNSIRGEGGDGK